MSFESHQNHPTTLIADVPLSTLFVFLSVSCHEITHLPAPCRASGVVIWQCDSLGSNRKASIEMR